MGMILVTLMMAPPSLLRLRCSTWKRNDAPNLKNVWIIFELTKNIFDTCIYIYIYSPTVRYIPRTRMVNIRKQKERSSSRLTISEFYSSGVSSTARLVRFSYLLILRGIIYLFEKYFTRLYARNTQSKRALARPI